jgi:thioester reductase-like protein
LGLDERTWDELSMRVDAVYHCGTSMNHLESYAMAKAVNVQGLQELLRLVTQGRPKGLNHISTLGIFQPVGSPSVRAVDELTPIDSERHLQSRGYVASKWVGERMVMTAIERGIPANIFRLGLVWADSVEGRYDEQQRCHRILLTAMRSNTGIRNYNFEMTPTPVDYVARAISHLGATHFEGGRIFHISSNHECVGGIFERCNEIAGGTLNLVSQYEWVQKIKTLHAAGLSLPAVPLFEFAFEQDKATFDESQRILSQRRIQFDCSLTQRELESARILTPEFDGGLLEVCVSNMLAQITADSMPRTHRSAQERTSGGVP